MLPIDLHSARRLLAFAAIATAAATTVFTLGHHPQVSATVSLAAPVSPANSTARVVWAHDDSLPDAAHTLAQQRLADEEPASTF
jgi:hypothetical protein